METEAGTGAGAPVRRSAGWLAGLASGGAAYGSSVPIWKQKWALVSAALHLALAALLFFPGFGIFDGSDERMLGNPIFQFRVAGGEGAGGGGGGGGSRGERISAYIPVRVEQATPQPEPETPREAPIAPRKPRPLRFEDLENLADEPDLTDIVLGGVFSPQAQDFPGLSLDDFGDYGGRDAAPSAGTGGGIGGGEGIGTGEGQG
ncbi:MAG: hypothetical protein F4Z65_01110, partial [Acidobacteria bacterium]|nr:hypothetical protein [Acidobacteriota bacterium]MYH21623.1 hypothetical protein [Acidobacteriota bacterium]